MKRDDFNKSRSAVPLFKQNVHNIGDDEREGKNDKHSEADTRIQFVFPAFEKAEENDCNHNENEESNRRNRMNKIQSVTSVSCGSGNAKRQNKRAADSDNISENIFIAAASERKNEIQTESDAYEGAGYAEAERIIKSGHTDCEIHRVSYKGIEREEQPCSRKEKMGNSGEQACVLCFEGFFFAVTHFFRRNDVCMIENKKNNTGGNNGNNFVKTVFAFLCSAENESHNNKNNENRKAGGCSGNEKSLHLFAFCPSVKPVADYENNRCIKNDVAEACKPVQQNRKRCNLSDGRVRHESCCDEADKYV